MLLGLILLKDCSGKEEESQLVRHPEPDLSLESPEADSDADLVHDATIWRNWKPWKLWKLGQ